MINVVCFATYKSQEFLKLSCCLNSTHLSEKYFVQHSFVFWKFVESHVARLICDLNSYDIRRCKFYGRF